MAKQKDAVEAIRAWRKGDRVTDAELFIAMKHIETTLETLDAFDAGGVMTLGLLTTLNSMQSAFNHRQMAASGAN